MNQPVSLNPDGFVSIGDLPSLGVPFKPSTIWAKVRSGEFVAPLKLSARCTVWRIGDVLDWQREQAAKARPTDNAIGIKLTAARQARTGVKPRSPQ